MTLETPLTARRFLIALALALLTVRCTDQTSPGPTGVRLTADQMAPEEATTHTLHQDGSAPALETYQLTFWAYRDEGADVRVN